jgi:hypothetical protein
LATASVVTLGVVAQDDADGSKPIALDSADLRSVAPPLSRDTLSRATVSRSESRLEQVKREGRHERTVNLDRQRAAATARAVRTADTKLWATSDLNLWSSPSTDATQVGLLEEGKRVLVTGREASGRVEVVVDGRSRWVTDGYLSDEKPVAATAGLSMAPCPDSSVESGLTSNAVAVYRSVCHAFPQITSYGGWDAHGEHSSGRAIDIMTSDVALGDAIAAFLQAHASELHLYDILWRQRIWTPVRASEGWRTFPDRGSPTANHYDHVHVSTY